jgi:hypothetical protein
VCRPISPWSTRVTAPRTTCRPGEHIERGLE